MTGSQKLLPFCSFFASAHGTLPQHLPALWIAVTKQWHHTLSLHHLVTKISGPITVFNLILSVILYLISSIASLLAILNSLAVICSAFDVVLSECWLSAYFHSLSSAIESVSEYISSPQYIWHSIILFVKFFSTVLQIPWTSFVLYQTCSEIIFPYFCLNCTFSCVFWNLTLFFFFFTCWHSWLRCLPFVLSCFWLDINDQSSFRLFMPQSCFILHFSSSIMIACSENNLDFYRWNFVKTFFLL